MHVGALIDYGLRVRGLPMRWQSEITAWEPPHRFVDEQRRAPYQPWRHEHEFVERDGGTVIRDKVEYAIPFDLMTHRLFVQPDIERIFAFREQKMRELFRLRSRKRWLKVFGVRRSLKTQSRFPSSVLDHSYAFRFEKDRHCELGVAMGTTPPCVKIR